MPWQFQKRLVKISSCPRVEFQSPSCPTSWLAEAECCMQKEQMCLNWSRSQNTAFPPPQEREPSKNGSCVVYIQKQTNHYFRFAWQGSKMLQFVNAAVPCMPFWGGGKQSNQSFFPRYTRGQILIYQGDERMLCIALQNRALIWNSSNMRPVHFEERVPSSPFPSEAQLMEKPGII